MKQPSDMKKGDGVSVSHRMPRGIYKGTREEWLEEAMHIMGAWINEFLDSEAVHTVTGHKTGTQLQYLVNKWGYKPSHYRFKADMIIVSCSLQGSGMTKASSLAHIHYAHATGNKKHEIRMSVELGGRKLKADSCRVADVLLHEMIHSCSVFHGHKRAFKHIAKGVGLEGKMTATIAGEELAKRIKNEVVDVLGKYPHRAVHLTPRGQRGKGSRLIKCLCVECGFNMRTTRKWIVQAYVQNGGIACPIGCARHMAHVDYDLPLEVLESL